MKSLKLLSAGLLVWAVLGCQAKNATLTNPPEKVSKVGNKGVALDFSFNSKVDVLFVIDDSLSMADEQKALSENIDKFVNEFAKFETIDFHIAVTRVTDLNAGSVAARQATAAQCAGKSPDHKIPYTSDITFVCKHVVANQAPRGQLVTLKNIDKSGQLVEYTDLPRYVTRETPDYLNVLKNTLKVGLKYVQYGGSEFEEVFHPLKGVFTNPEVQKTNAGFFRPDAAVLAVFVLTDADDASTYPETKGAPARPNPTLTAETTAAFFTQDLKFKGKLLTFAGLSLGACQKDPILEGGKMPTGILDFLSYTSGRSMDICSRDLGPKLAEFGNQIKKEIMTKGFALTQGQPEIKTLKVFYGGREVPQRNSKGEQMWGYEVDANGHNPRVVITENIELTQEKGAVFSAEYTPLVMKNVKNGRTNITGLYSNPKK